MGSCYGSIQVKRFSLIAIVLGLVGGVAAGIAGAAMAGPAVGMAAGLAVGGGVIATTRRVVVELQGEREPITPSREGTAAAGSG